MRDEIPPPRYAGFDRRLFCLVFIAQQGKTDCPEIHDVSYNARADEEQPRHRVLVLPFLDERVDQSKKMSEVARQTVVRELLATRQFVVVAVEDFPQDPKKFMTEENEYDLTQIAKIASGMGVAAVIEGKVLSIQAKRMGDSIGLVRSLKAQVSSKVRLRIFAGKNGKEILNEIRSAETEASTTRVGEKAEVSNNLAEDPELLRPLSAKLF